MRIAVGADHAGYELKADLVAYLRTLRHEVTDVGTHSLAPVDYPDIAELLGRTLLLTGRAKRGILICGSGVGASVAANKLPGIRAGLCHDTYSAHQGVEHDDMNVLVLGARVVGTELARELVRAFVGAKFTHEERHERRLEKIRVLEQGWPRPAARDAGARRVSPGRRKRKRPRTVRAEASRRDPGTAGASSQGVPLPRGVRPHAP